jgi:hypothetical protein
VENKRMKLDLDAVRTQNVHATSTNDMLRARMQEKDTKIEELTTHANSSRAKEVDLECQLAVAKFRNGVA